MKVDDAQGAGRPADDDARQVSSAARTRLRRGLGGQAFAQAVGFAVHLGGVPLFLYFWGASLYGEWLVLAALPAWLVFSNLGFTSATVNEATMCVTRGEPDAALGAFRTTWVFMTAVSFAVAVLLVLGTMAVPLASWFGFSGLDDGAASVILALLLLQVLINMQAELAAAGLYGAGHYGLHAFLAASTRLGAFAMVALVLVLGGGLVAAAAAMAGAECAGLAVMVVAARRHGPWMRYGLAGASRATLRRLARPSLGFVGFTAGNALVIQGPILVVGAALGPAAVAVFATLRLPARGLAMLGNVVFSTLRPEMTMAHGEGDAARLRRLHARTVQLSLWLGIAGFTALMLLGPELVEVWTVGRIAVEQPLFGWLAAGSVATLLSTGVATVLHATNHHEKVALLYVTVAVAGLAAGSVAAGFAGASGVAAALAISEFVVLVLALKWATAFVGQGFGALAGAALRPPVDVLGWLRTPSP